MAETLLVFPRTRYPSGDPPLGVAYLAACMRQAGHPVSIFDATFARKPMDDLAALLESRPIRLLAISSLTSMLSSAVEMARVAKRVSPDTTVILGGPHSTVAPEISAALDCIDAVHIGEGERSLPALAANDFDFRALPGFAYMDGDQLINNGCGESVADLDDIPYPAWDLLDMDRYLRLWFQLDAVAFGLRGTSIISSRGCPFNCAYCQPTLRTIFGSSIRRRSVDNVIGELFELKDRYKIKGVMWLDDTFLIDREWMREFCTRAIDENLNLVWGGNVRADVVDRPTLEIMKQAGLRVVHLGIESATQRILDDIYQKGITIEQVRDAVELSRDVGLNVRGYFMLGAPTESESEAWDTVQLACSLPLDDATFSITTPLPHTHLWEKTRELIGRDMTEFDYYKKPVYGGDDVIPAARLVQIKRIAYLRFYLGRKRLWRTIRSVLSPVGVQKTMLKLMRF